MVILNVLSDTVTNGYKVEALDAISLASIFCGMLVVICKNPIRSVLFLIGLFVSIACYLVLLGLDFLGIAYLLVYVGAVSILFLFILMLINIRISELQSNNSNSITLSIVIGVAFYFPLFQLLPYDIAILSNINNILYVILYNVSLNKNNSSSNVIDLSNNDLYFVTSKVWDANLWENSHISAIGNIMYTNYNIWLIITCFILLLAMVGSIVITIKQR